MYLHKPSAVVYLTPNSVVVVGKKIAAARLALAVDILSNLEIINHDKYVECCKRFFTEQGLRGRRVVIVLDPRITFTKTLLLDKIGNPTALTTAFVNVMPFEAGQRACITVNTGSQLRIFATNAQLFTAAEEALRQTGHIKVSAITPAAAYDLSAIEKSFAAAAALYMRDTETPKTTNFLEAHTY